MTPEQLLDAALQYVESESIRAWVATQRKIWLKIAAQALESKKYATPETFAAYIVGEAIGLWE